MANNIEYQFIEHNINNNVNGNTDTEAESNTNKQLYLIENGANDEYDNLCCICFEKNDVTSIKFNCKCNICIHSSCFAEMKNFRSLINCPICTDILCDSRNKTLMFIDKYVFCSYVGIICFTMLINLLFIILLYLIPYTRMFFANTYANNSPTYSDHATDIFTIINLLSNIITTIDTMFNFFLDNYFHIETKKIIKKITIYIRIINGIICVSCISYTTIYDYFYQTEISDVVPSDVFDTTDVFDTVLVNSFGNLCDNSAEASMCRLFDYADIKNGLFDDANVLVSNFNNSLYLPEF